MMKGKGKGHEGDGVKGGGKGGSFTEDDWKGMGYHKFVRSLPKAAEYNWRRCSCEFLNAPNRLPPHNPSRVCNAFKGVPTNRICDKLLSKCVPCNSSGEPKPDVPGSPPAKKTTKRKKQRQNQAAKRTDGAWNVAGAEEGEDSDEEKFEIDDGEDPEETERKKQAKLFARRRKLDKAFENAGLDASAPVPPKGAQDDDMPVDEDAFDQADRRAAHLERKPKIDKAWAAILTIQSLGDDAPDGMANQLLLLTQQVADYDQEGKDIASPKAKKNMLRLAHVKAAKACANKKLEVEQCQKALEDHRQAIAVATAEIAKLEPVLVQLREEQVQTAQAKDDAHAAWTKAKGGEAKPVVTVAGATGSSPTALAKIQLDGMKAIFAAAKPEVLDRHVGANGMAFFGMFETAFSNLCQDDEYCQARPDELPPANDQIIPLQNVYLQRAATSLTEHLNDEEDCEIPEVEAEPDPEKKRKLKAAHQAKAQDSSKKAKGMVKKAAVKLGCRSP
jgi:hypothetical protein